MRLSLANRISITVIGVLTLAMLSSIASIVSAFRFEDFLTTLVADNLESVRAAEELEIALLEQRGYVASYILDGGNKEWLDSLDRHRKYFDDWLIRARNAARSDEEREILDQLEEVQRAYARKRDEVVRLYDGGDVDRARHVLLHDVNNEYQKAFDLCERFIDANQSLVGTTTRQVRSQVERITALVTVILAVTIGLGSGLLWLFFRGVIIPLRQISTEARIAAGDKRHEPVDPQTDELRELGHHVQLLMTDVAQTRSDLEQSRTRLAHADRLAAVGKLAASVAHEIRNPLTSIKMWLYSLRRGVSQDRDTQQKFQVVSDELTRLEGIVSNFLEFARPPRLKLESQPVGLLIDKTIELIRYGLEDQRITLDREIPSELPLVMADTEQMRQVFLNLLKNAIEAMPEGGKIRVSSSLSNRGGLEMVAVRVADTGSGISQEVQERILEPFFTTKEDGSGLGLCIAASVMARHHGLLELESSDSRGTQFAVWIPTAGRSHTAK